MRLIITLFTCLFVIILEAFGVEPVPISKKSSRIKESKNFKIKIAKNKKIREFNLESIFISGLNGNNTAEQKNIQQNTQQKAKNPNTIDFNNLKNLKEYKKYMNKTRSNTKNLTHSRSFYDIMNKVTELFPKHLTKQDADLEILKVRNSDIDQVTDYFVTLNINSTSEYWYFYYILSNVALRGKIVGLNMAKDWKKNYPDDLLEQENSDDQFYLNLKKTQDQLF